MLVPPTPQKEGEALMGFLTVGQRLTGKRKPKFDDYLTGLAKLSRRKLKRQLRSMTASRRRKVKRALRKKQRSAFGQCELCGHPKQLGHKCRVKVTQKNQELVKKRLDRSGREIKPLRTTR